MKKKFKKVNWFGGNSNSNKGPLFKPVKLPTKKSVKTIKKKNLTWPQAQVKYPKIKAFADADRDGKINMFDCKPFNKKKHGIVKKPLIMQKANRLVKGRPSPEFKATRQVNFPQERTTVLQDKEVFYAGTVKDVMEADEITINHPRTKEPMRKLKRKNGKVELTLPQLPHEPPLVLDENHPIYYEPWFEDSGSYIFEGPENDKILKGQQLKLATEFDEVEYDDGKPDSYDDIIAEAEHEKD